MSPSEFIPSLESELALLGMPYARADLLAWVASMWPWIAEDADAARWASEFADSRQQAAIVA
jgi:hypothetical protein